MKPEEKLAVHELLSKLAYHYDEKAVDQLMALFSDKATMSLRITDGELVGPFTGREAIGKLMADSLSTQTDQRRHVVSNIFFESEGSDYAKVISNLTLVSIEDGKLTVLSTAVYHDTVVKEAGLWVVGSRHVALDMPY